MKEITTDQFLMTNKRKTIWDGTSYIPRIFYRKKKSNQLNSCLIKCGCCNEKVEIYYGNDTYWGNVLEINGVLASKKTWITIFNELVKEEKNNLTHTKELKNGKIR